MNVNMWNNTVVQNNIAKLKSLSYQILEPVEGMLACGYKGKGRLENISIIKQEIIKNLKKTIRFSGEKIIVTSRGTIEKLDEVRYISNKSSGKMGVAIAEECYLQGADVLLLRSKNSVSSRYAIEEYTYETADELLELIKKNISSCDIFFHVAAVSDFYVVNRTNGKISSEKTRKISLKPRKKIIDQIKLLNPKTFLVGFKAEYGLNEKKLIETSYNRLISSQSDIIVANDVSRNDSGFGSDFNEVILVSKNKKIEKISLRPKREVARLLLDFVSKNL